MELKNKTIFLTGASGGIGSAILTKLAQHDVKIYAHYNGNKEIIDSIALKSPAEIITVKADFSDMKIVKKTMEFVAKEAGSLDMVINAYGVEDTSNPDPLDTEGWEKVLRVNLFSVVEICRLSLPILNKDGLMVNISSIMAKHDIAVPIELTSYAMSKAALNKFTLNVAYNYADRLRAVTISPGYTLTKMWDAFDEKMKQESVDATPIKRFVSPEEIAKSVVSVIENDAVTMQDIVVDGGLGIKLIS